MKIVVFGPEKRTGVLRGDEVVDISRAYAKLIGERDGERKERQIRGFYDGTNPEDIERLLKDIKKLKNVGKLNWFQNLFN